MKVDVRNWDNEVVDELELPNAVFAQPAKNHVVYEVIKAYLGGIRRGTHATKTRAMVAGGGKKPWKQKGTGRARAGSTRSPLWRHGGTAHGPQPRSYQMKVNVKAKKSALRSVLSDRLAKGKLLILDSLEVDSHRTKEFVARMARLNLGAEKVLFVDSYENLNLMLATRNRRELEVADAIRLHVYDVMNHRQVVLSRRAALTLAEVLSS